jgi:hypothetical protein
MASIVLRNIRCIDYLAYVSIFTRAMFLLKKNLMFFPREVMERGFARPGCDNIMLVPKLE